MMVPLTDEGREMIEALGREMQQRQARAGGLLRSAIGKARGQALRLALVLELLWWCGEDGMTPPPVQIGAPAVGAAATLTARCFLPVAERGCAGAAPSQRPGA